MADDSGMQERRGSPRSSKSVATAANAAGAAQQYQQYVDGLLQGSKSVAGAAAEGLSKAMKKASGSEFRENWQEFSESVTTIVVGLHREVTALRGQVKELEKRSSARSAITLATIALVVSLIALVVALI